MGTRIVVVGGVAAGASAATKARRTDESAEITIFERGPYVSFANCGLPYYVGGDIPRVSDLLMMTPQRFDERFRIRVELQHEVTAVDVAGKRVNVVDVRSGVSRWVPYDRLVIATGGRPVMPPIQGIGSPGVFPMTTVPEAQATREWIQRHEARSAVVVGAGYIGLEAVEAMLNLGLKVDLVEKLNQVLPLLDPEMVAPVATHLAAKGVQLHLGAEVTRFIGDGRLTGVELAGGAVISADVAIVAIGVRPDLGLARQAGLSLGPTGGVLVDDRMRTSAPDVYACGDIVESRSRVTGQPARVPLAGPANKQGRVAGSNAAGGDLTFPGVIGTSIVKVCDLTAAKTGLSEREARQLGYDALASFTHSNDHASYYPGSKRMSIKVVADRATCKLLGAQVVGQSGVDKRIDVFATALYAGLDVEDLEGLDLAYAPPYSSAKDPVNMAGFVAANELRGELKVVTSSELARRLDAGEAMTVLDVRDPGEYAAGHIPGALLIPLDKLRCALDRVPLDKPVVAYCGVGYRSYHASKILMHHGYQVENLSGGFTSWSQACYDRVTRD
jgi:NADPH-dependent 2,4-dienoyl-CoA reductase/sulfur reductase-like enzyme/rhodanese-related sulfurtransferase